MLTHVAQVAWLGARDSLRHCGPPPPPQLRAPGEAMAAKSNISSGGSQPTRSAREKEPETQARNGEQVGGHDTMEVRLATISERDESASELEQQDLVAMLQADSDESDEDNRVRELLNERRQQRRARLHDAQVQAAAAAAAAAAAEVLTFDEDDGDTLKQLSNEGKQERKSLQQQEAEQKLLWKARRRKKVAKILSAATEADVNKFDEDTLKQLVEEGDGLALGKLGELLAEPLVDAIATQVANARELILSSSTPAASAQALVKMGIAVALCPPENKALETRLKDAENLVRDSAVWRCQVNCADSGKLVQALSNRHAFVSQVQAVFGMSALED